LQPRPRFHGRIDQHLGRGIADNLRYLHQDGIRDPRIEEICLDDDGWASLAQLLVAIDPLHQDNVSAVHALSYTSKAGSFQSARSLMSAMSARTCS